MRRAAPPPPPPVATASAYDGETGATIALAVVTVAAVLSMRRLFDGWSYAGPVITAALATHLGAWWARRRDGNIVWAPAAPLAALAVVVSWVLYPETTFYAIPTADTLRTMQHELHNALNDFHTMVAPAPATHGFILACVLGAVLVAGLADWAAFRMRAALESTIPSFGLFVFVAALGTSRGRTLSTTIELASILAFVLVHEATQQSRIAGWVGNRSSGAAMSVAKAGGAIAGVALVVALVAAPRLPGASSSALVSWRASSTSGSSARSTVSPFVDIRGRLQENSDVEVFTVTTTEHAYWRLTSLDTFNGSIWSSNDSYKSVKSKLPASGSDAPGPRVTQEFSIKALDSIWLPAAYQPVEIKDVKDVSYNADSGSLISSKETTDGLTYEVTSVSPRYTPDELSHEPAVDVAAMQRYLALPPISRRVAQLAADIVRGKTTEYDKAKALQDYLRTNYKYELNVQLSHDSSAIDQFLFTVRKGYCEQFAGAYAVMARAIGLPTRVAVGFTPGVDEGGGVLHVRDEHAHAWPEVYFPNAGWVPFEPTPGRGVPGAEAYTGVPENQVGGVSNPTTPTTIADPSTTVAGDNSTATTIHDDPSDTSTLPADKTSHRSPLIAVAEVAGVLALLAIAWIVGVPTVRQSRRRRRRQAAATPNEQVMVAWTEANEALAQAGAGRRATETFAEHAQRAARLARFEPDARRALGHLAADADAAGFAASELPAAVAERARQEAAVVEEAVAAELNGRQRFLRRIDPRPLIPSWR